MSVYEFTEIDLTGAFFSFIPARSLTIPEIELNLYETVSSPDSFALIKTVKSSIEPTISNQSSFTTSKLVGL